MAKERVKSGNYAVCASIHAEYHQQHCIGYQPHVVPVTPENFSRLISEFKNRKT